MDHAAKSRATDKTGSITFSQEVSYITEGKGVSGKGADFIPR